MNIRVETSIRFNDVGIVGAALFVCCPVGSGIAYGRLPAFFLFVFGVGFLVGCIMMLLGRTYTHQVHIERDAS